jgi:ribonuclease HI
VLVEEQSKSYARMAPAWMWLYVRIGKSRDNWPANWAQLLKILLNEKCQNLETQRAHPGSSIALGSQLADPNHTEMHLFTDCSVAPRKRIGVGGYLWVESIENSSNLLADKIKLNTFENVSSTELELRTLLWALESFSKSGHELYIYTDSQNIVSLLDRRKRLEKNVFRNASGKLLKHNVIYREFYQMADDLNFDVIKVKGHCRSAEKSGPERIFSLLDRSTRKELRKQLNTKEPVSNQRSL